MLGRGLDKGRKQMKIVGLDLETTGIGEGHKIIEYCGIVLGADLKEILKNQFCKDSIQNVRLTQRQRQCITSLWQT